MDLYYLVLGLLLLGVYLVAMAIGLAEYIISSLAMYRIACKRGVSNPWLAWIPLANIWTFGSVVDNFESEKGSKRKFRVILLTIALVMIALVVLVAIVVASYLIIAVFSNSIPTGDEDIIFMISFYMALLPFAFVATAYEVLYIICLYKLHENIYPEKSIKYTIISFLVPLGHAICLLKNSKRCEEKVVLEAVAPAVEVEPEVVADEKIEKTVEEVVETEKETEEE